jgi:uncharacterized protein (TIGR02452 family)
MFDMGREEPTVVLRQNQNRRDERAKRARDTKNRVIPDMLRSCPKAKHGIAKAELIVDPSPVNETPQRGSDPVMRPDLKIRVKNCDTLSAASSISERAGASRRIAPSVKARSDRPNVAILNMASALRPGGGFLDGANSQEEFLCARTTLYPSLWDQYYRLPEVGGIYTPDVLVFRDNNTEDNDLHKRDRYFVDVISSSMLRFSDAKSEGCTCGVSFCDRHRDLVLRKMKAVLRIAQSKGVQRLILGAWGCGAYGNPVKEIAKAWRKVIAGAPRQRRPNAERWEGIDEIIFAIPDRTMLREFDRAFSDVITEDIPTPASEIPPEVGAKRNEEMERTSEVFREMAEVELQLEHTTNSRLKRTLKERRAALERELSQGNKASKDDDASDGEQNDADDYVMTGFLGSDDEQNPFFTVNDFDSDDSAPAASGSFEFRPPPPGMDSQTSHDEESQDEIYPALSHSPNFDPETGWFTGSMDGLTALINANGGLRSCSRNSPKSPDIMRPTSSGLPIDADALHEYLSRHGGTDDMDY